MFLPQMKSLVGAENWYESIPLADEQQLGGACWREISMLVEYVSREQMRVSAQLALALNPTLVCTISSRVNL